MTLVSQQMGKAIEVTVAVPGSQMTLKVPFPNSCVFKAKMTV